MILLRENFYFRDYCIFRSITMFVHNTWCWTREIHWFIPQNLLGKKLYTSQNTRGGIRSCDDMLCMTSTIMRLMVRKDNKNLKKLWYWFWSWILILFMPRSSYKTSDKFFSLTLSFLISSIRIISLICMFILRIGHTTCKITKLILSITDSDLK